MERTLSPGSWPKGESPLDWPHGFTDVTNGNYLWVGDFRPCDARLAALASLRFRAEARRLVTACAGHTAGSFVIGPAARAAWGPIAVEAYLSIPDMDKPPAVSDRRLVNLLRFAPDLTYANPHWRTRIEQAVFENTEVAITVCDVWPSDGVEHFLSRLRTNTAAPPLMRTRLHTSVAARGLGQLLTEDEAYALTQSTDPAQRQMGLLTLGIARNQADQEPKPASQQSSTAVSPKPHTRRSAL